MSLEAYIATTRFGLGARPGELDSVRDARAWLKQQIANPVIPPSIGAMPKRSEILDMIGSPKGKNAESKTKEAADAKKLLRRRMQQEFMEQCATRFNAQVQTTQPFIERLVLFWSNHFTVSAQKNPIVPLVNPYEAHAIRPYLTGNFADLLIAVVQHPAMLIYLDNAHSVGPNSRGGQRREKGLNENLAREILELHTMGVGSGYTQNDVIALAKIITGWSVKPRDAEFMYNPNLHEPGAKTLLGKNFEEQGVQEGLQALRMIAMQPATARHLATKLARHFIADVPPAAAVDRLAKSYLDSSGDLKQVYTTLIDLSEPWTMVQSKVKTTYEYVLSACRVQGVTFNGQQLARQLASLNYRLFNAASPAGESDTAMGWVSSDSVMKRIEWSKVFARQFPPKSNPLDLAQQVFGPIMRQETAFIIKGAASPQDGLAFLLSSPEFQRR